MGLRIMNKLARVVSSGLRSFADYYCGKDLRGF
jgi:hypothetical protein